MVPRHTYLTNMLPLYWYPCMVPYFLILLSTSAECPLVVLNRCQNVHTYDRRCLGLGFGRASKARTTSGIGFVRSFAQIVVPHRALTPRTIRTIPPEYTSAPTFTSTFAPSARGSTYGGRSPAARRLGGPQLHLSRPRTHSDPAHPPDPRLSVLLPRPLQSSPLRRLCRSKPSCLLRFLALW